MPRVPSEVVYESYALKATFFYDKLSSLGYFDIYSKITALIDTQGSSYGWRKKAEWGVSDKAWKIIEDAGIHPIYVFCHPKILRLHPAFLKYYRSVSLLPQKGLMAISRFSSVKVTEEEDREISENSVNKIVNSINAVISLVIEMSDKIDAEIIKAMLFATAGTTIDGSWRNAIGAEGERVIRSIILQSLFENKELQSYTDKKDRSFAIDESYTLGLLLSNISQIKSLTAINGNTVFFSSEPDVRIIDKDNETVGAIEVKAGLDPAGALERLGAMFKSFDNILVRHPSAETILVASCITEEVEARLREARSVRQTYILTEIIAKKGQKDKVFTNKVRTILGLIKSSM